jgi:hypothetical protein
MSKLYLSLPVVLLSLLSSLLLLRSLPVPHYLPVSRCRCYLDAGVRISAVVVV